MTWPTTSSRSFRFGTIEFGLHTISSHLPVRAAVANTRTTWPANTTIMIAAQMRWISIVPLKPPSRRANACAQAWSATSSGMPVSAQPMNVNIRAACITRSSTSKRL